MELSLHTLVLLPIGLGLLGFIEPCTIGGHLMFLDTQSRRPTTQKLSAMTIFIGVRAVITGLFGALIAFLGQGLIGLQTGLWLVFGLIYLAIGIVFLIGRSGLAKMKIDFAPSAWKSAQNPVVLGLAFGLNIPACAAPILFSLLSVAATTGTAMSGFVMMFLFGLFLSLPLVVFAIVPKLASWLDSFGQKLKQMNWVLGLIFVLLGLWSIWFGLHVNPADWSGR